MEAYNSEHLFVRLWAIWEVIDIGYKQLNDDAAFVVHMTLILGPLSLFVLMILIEL